MEEKVLFIFWDGSFRLLSTGGMGVECGSREEAMQMLFNGIAANESDIGYLNQIYDNAQVELQPDNMQTITVLDFYYIQDIYIGHKSERIADTTLTYEPADHKKPIGMAYARKNPEGYMPDFALALSRLMAEMKKRGEEYREEEKKLLDGHIRRF